MKKLLIVATLVFVGIAGYRIGDLVSHDVIVMSIGVLFGVLAGIPAALLVMATQRRPSTEFNPPRHDYRSLPAPQPPIIWLGGNLPQQPGPGYPQPYAPRPEQAPPWGATGGGNYHLLTGPAQDQRFTADDDDLKRKWSGH